MYAAMATLHVKLCQIGVADSKDKQKGAIASFVLGSDVLFILPTGYGQSLCFTLLLMFQGLLDASVYTC